MISKAIVATAKGTGRGIALEELKGIPSMLKTLAHSHKSTVRRMHRRFRAEVYHRGRTLKCYEAKLVRPNKEPLTARFGGLRLSTDPFLEIKPNNGLSRPPDTSGITYS